MLASMFTLIVATVAAPAVANVIPGQYIVVFKDHVKDTKAAMKKYMSHLNSASGFAEAPESTVLEQYDLPTFHAGTIKLADSFAGSVELTPNEDVAFIQQDHVVRELSVQDNAPWGLRRISSREKPADDAPYFFPENPLTEVDVYVLDTGIDRSHPEFSSSVVFGADFTGEGEGDGRGHGTHVAGTVGSNTFGVAKKANIFDVRVLGSDGSGSDSTVIGGIEWAVKQAIERNERAGKIVSVANLSLGGDSSPAIDAVVKAATDAGLVIVAAAGNSAGDACAISPAGAPSAITVAASDINDQIARFSERGTCVDIIAPGVNVLSTWLTGRVRAISGTSMAAPHVAGVVALALSERNFTSVEEVSNYIVSIATPDKITGDLRETVNRLLFSEFK
jgi:cerevisin